MKLSQNLKKIYIVIPYTGIEEESFKLANIHVSKLMNLGFIPFSLISHSHTLTKQCDVPGNWSYWEEYGKSFIEWSDALYVIVIDKDKIKKSNGVQGELKIARELNKKIFYYDPYKNIYLKEENI